MLPHSPIGGCQRGCWHRLKHIQQTPLKRWNLCGSLKLPDPSMADTGVGVGGSALVGVKVVLQTTPSVVVKIGARLN